MLAFVHDSRLLHHTDTQSPSCIISLSDALCNRLLQSSTGTSYMSHEAAAQTLYRCSQPSALERQGLPCTYLAPHEPESINVIVVIVIISIIINIIIKINVGADDDLCRMAISSDRL